MLNVIVSHTFETEQQAQMLGYLTHALCLGGEAEVELIGRKYRLHRGDSFILRKSEQGELISKTEDFQILNVLVVTEFTELATPMSNYGMRGGMLLFQNPVMPLNEEQTERLRRSMVYIEECLAMTSHLFYRDMLLNAVHYYADRLCVTSKYLSETVKKYSGYPANHWINRYTALDISRLLRNPNVTIQELTDLFGFSSVGHLNRYVKNQLGVNPNEVRK